MAFPWSRSDSAAEALPADRRGHTRGRRERQEEARRASSRSARERRHQRMAFAVGGGLVLVIVGILAFGVYQEFYTPPRAWAGSVRNVEFTMGDLVKRIRVLQGVTGQVNLGTVPFEYLRNMLDAEILRQASPGLGITITEADIDGALRGPPPLGFSPVVPAGQETDPGQLEREFQNNYQLYLDRTKLSDQDYRIIVGEQLADARLRALLFQSIQDPQEQVEVEWIRMDPDSGISAIEVMDRLELQDFTTVAKDVGVSLGFADPNGYVGWVPRQAFPDLDAVLYGNEKKDTEPLGMGEISDPTFTVGGVYIIRKVAGPEERELTDVMRAKLNSELVLVWQRQQQIRGAEEGWMKMKFNSKWYDWVADQVRISAPNLPPGQGGR